MTTTTSNSPLAAYASSPARSTYSLLRWRNRSRPAPLYLRIHTWLLMPLLLFLAVNGVFSFLSSANSEFGTQYGAVAQTAQGIRPIVVLYFLSLVGFLCFDAPKLFRVALRNKLILATLAMAAFSAAWSHEPALTLRVSFELLLCTFFAFFLSEKFEPEKLMDLLMLLGLVSAVASIFLALALPGYGIFARYAGGAWQGIYSHKNAMGVSMAFLLSPAFFSSRPRDLRLAYAALMLFLVAMSQSRGAWFVAFAEIAFILWIKLFQRLKRNEAVLLMLVTVAIVAGGAMAVATNLGPIMNAIGKDPTMSGRTGIYQVVIQSILKKPVIGYGYGAFWRPANPEAANIGLAINWPNIGYAENGFLELALQIGLLGLGLTVLLFARAMAQAIALLRSPFFTPKVGWYCAIIAVQLLTNIEAGIVVGSGNLNWILTLIAFIGLANESRYAARAKQIHSLA